MPDQLTVTSRWVDPATGRTRVTSTVASLPTLAELQAKAAAEELYRDDLIIEIRDADDDSGHVIDLVDPISGAFDLGVGELRWRCDSVSVTTDEDEAPA